MIPAPRLHLYVTHIITRGRQGRGCDCLRLPYKATPPRVSGPVTSDDGSADTLHTHTWLITRCYRFFLDPQVCDTVCDCVCVCERLCETVCVTVCVPRLVPPIHRNMDLRTLRSLHLNIFFLEADIDGSNN